MTWDGNVLHLAHHMMIEAHELEAPFIGSKWGAVLYIGPYGRDGSMAVGYANDEAGAKAAAESWARGLYQDLERIGADQ